MSSAAQPSAGLPQASVSLTNEGETLAFSKINPAIRESKQWRILVYGIDPKYEKDQNDHHWSLLSGVLGKKVSVNKQTLPSISFKKNGVTVTAHIGSHAECDVSVEAVDLLLCFLPVDQENPDTIISSYTTRIAEITEKRGAMIWKHSIAVLTGVDKTVDYLKKEKGNISDRLETLLKSWTSQIQQALASTIGNDENVTKTDVLIRPAGSQDQPDLPKPHEKWFSQVWLGCFASSKVESMPAVIKLAQERIANNVSNQEILHINFSEQPIQAKENSVDLPQNLKVGLGIGGSTAIAGAAAIGATTGALIGALAIGIPSFGVAAGTGLALGAVIGGGVGAGIAGAAVGGGYHAAKNKQLEEISVTELKLYYAVLLTRIPKMCDYLRKWAEKQVSCRIVVAGVKEEGVSTVAAALTGKEPREGGSRLYWKQVISMKANLVVHDCEGFPKVANKQEKAKELVAFQKSKDTNLLIFCIPMTSSKKELVYSPHVKYLERLCEIDTDVLSNTVIVLTHANEMRAEMRKQNVQTRFQHFFTAELDAWKEQIKLVLTKYTHIEEAIADNIPVLPVGDINPSIDLSDNERPSPATQYHWLSELLLHVMPATKPEGLPTLIKTNEKRLKDHPNEYSDQENAKKLIIDGKCAMFSQVGLKDKKHPGEAIGLILGVSD